MDSKDVDQITKRLDTIIALLSMSMQKPDKPRSLREQIERLDAAGLGPTDIAFRTGVVKKMIFSLTS